MCSLRASVPRRPPSVTCGWTQVDRPSPDFCRHGPRQGEGILGLCPSPPAAGGLLGVSLLGLEELSAPVTELGEAERGCGEPALLENTTSDATCSPDLAVFSPPSFQYLFLRKRIRSQHEENDSFILQLVCF